VLREASLGTLLFDLLTAAEDRDYATRFDIALLTSWLLAATQYLADAAVLTRVRAPTLLIVGGDDREVLALNRDAYAHLTCAKSLHTVPGATHLFEEPGALDQVAAAAADWFRRWLVTEPRATP
jgi:pimeloyl-ACP methyl ester carboxylesterase